MPKYDLEKILPHDKPMILLDDLREIDLKNGILISEFQPKREMLFASSDGIDALCGIEFMAQTIGCYAYFKNAENKPQKGLLLGTRLYNNSTDYFLYNQTYTVKVHEVFTDGEIVVFDCIIYDRDGEEVSCATVNAYQGEGIEELLKNG